MDFVPIATSFDMIAVAPDGREAPVRVEVGMPAPTGEMEWGCPIRVAGWDGHAVSIRNVDGFGALALAIRSVYLRFADFEGRGGRFLDPESREAVPILDFFSIVGGPATPG